jgi:hypothetical protein
MHARRLIEKASEILRELGLPLFCRPCRNLHGDRPKSRVVALREALNERLELFGSGHSFMTARVSFETSDQAHSTGRGRQRVGPGET